jgi:tetratricopeptide (TPR) repeat protein
MLLTYFEPPINMLQAVVDAVSDALEIDADSAEALSSLGLAYVLAWRWEDAWTVLNAARERDPDLVLTELGFALYYSGLGDHDGVIRSVERANRIDPLNIELADWGQWALTMVGEVDAARAWTAEKIRQHPDVGIVFTGASIPASINGDHEEAIALGETGLEKDPGSAIAMITLAQIYGAAGQTEKVQPLLDRAEAIGGYMCPYETAVARLNLGQTDQVFALLDEAVAYRSNCLVFLRSDPRMEPVRDDPRYDRLLSRVGLDDTSVSGYRR